MGTFQVGLLLIGTFALLLALSVPVSVSIIISSVVTMASTLSLDLGTFVASQRMVGGVDSFSLLAVPFYILCGVLMNTGGIAQKLIDFAKILVGRIPGGLAHTNILGNTLFGSLSGSSVAVKIPDITPPTMMTISSRLGMASTKYLKKTEAGTLPAVG